MFKDIISNEEAKKFLINELKNKKEQGTYLFYGEDREFLMTFAISFAKSLTCKTISHDFCGECESCKRMEARTHGDLEIYECEDEKNNGIKIDAVREIIKRASTASYEGGNRVFILRDVEQMNSQAANAMLKILEEPKKGDFFILLANNLNIIATIKSRATILRVKMRTAEELGVSQEEYDFFLGNGSDILVYKNSDVDVATPKPYKEIGTFIRNYKENMTIENKSDIYKALRDFMANRKFITSIEKMKFSEEIYFNSSKDKVLIQEICNYICHLIKDYNNLSRVLILKNTLRQSVNLKLFLKVFVNEIY